MAKDNQVLFVAIDLGSSLTKVFYQDQDKQQPLIMTPDVAWIQPQQVDDLAINKNTAPEFSAWLQLGTEEIVAVGQWASNFGGDSGMIERKQERAVHKVLAVLGVLHEKLRLPAHFPAHLAVMLPITEFKDRLRVQEILKVATSNFAFRSQPLSVQTQSCLVLPEGFGLYTVCKNNIKQRGIEPSTRTIFVLMFGHRNLSVLVFQNGTLQAGQSSSDGPGFHEAVKAAATAAGIRATDYPQLLKALALKQTRMRVAGQFETVDIKEAVATGRSSYWKQVDSYLRNALTPLLKDDECEFVVSGGAAWTMQFELSELFERIGLQNRVSWAAGLQGHLDNLLSNCPEFQNKKDLGLRMTDVFATLQIILQSGKSTVAASA